MIIERQTFATFDKNQILILFIAKVIIFLFFYIAKENICEKIYPETKLFFKL